jgi:hypothetical protein
VWNSKSSPATYSKRSTPNTRPGSRRPPSRAPFRGPFFCQLGALSRPSRARPSSSRRPCGIDRPAALPARARYARARPAPMLELEGRPGVSLAGGRRPVVRVTLSAVSTAGALSPWCVVRGPRAVRPGARARGAPAVVNRRSVSCCRRRGPVYVIRGPGSGSPARGPRAAGRGPRAAGPRCPAPGRDPGAVYVIPWPCMSSGRGPLFVSVYVIPARVCLSFFDYPGHFLGIMGRGARRNALGKIARNSGQKTGRFAGFAGVCQISDGQ